MPISLILVRERRDCIIRQTHFGPRALHSSLKKLVRSPPRVATPTDPKQFRSESFTFTFQEACQVTSQGRLATGPMQLNALQLRSADIMTSSVHALRHIVLLRHEVTSRHVWDLVMAQESPDHRLYFIIIDFRNEIINVACVRMSPAGMRLGRHIIPAIPAGDSHPSGGHSICLPVNKRCSWL
jgi:hypothetical protein